jgi:hypothetical protein
MALTIEKGPQFCDTWSLQEPQLSNCCSDAIQKRLSFLNSPAPTFVATLAESSIVTSLVNWAEYPRSSELCRNDKRMSTKKCAMGIDRVARRGEGETINPCPVSPTVSESPKMKSPEANPLAPQKPSFLWPDLASRSAALRQLPTRPSRPAWAPMPWGSISTQARRVP